MRPIATDVALSAGYDREPHKMDEPIKMLFGVLTQADPRNHALGEVQVTGAILGGHPHTMQPFVITLTTSSG